MLGLTYTETTLTFIINVADSAGRSYPPRYAPLRLYGTHLYTWEFCDVEMGTTLVPSYQVWVSPRAGPSPRVPYGHPQYHPSIEGPGVGQAPTDRCPDHV